MKQIRNAWQAAILWKLAIAKLILSVIAIIGVSIQTVLSPVVWASLSGQEQFLVVVGIITLCGINISSFLDRTAGELQKGRPPIGDAPIKDQPENG